MKKILYIIVSFGLVCLFGMTIQVNAQTAPDYLTVNSLADTATVQACPAETGKPCTLRFALQAIANGGTIYITVPGTINIGTNGSYKILKSVTIQGRGKSDPFATPISGTVITTPALPDYSLRSRIFEIMLPSATLHLRDLTLAGGYVKGESGGAILNNGGTANLTRVRLDSNRAEDSNGGGAIYTAGGTITLVDCEVKGNSATGNLERQGTGGAITNMLGKVKIDSTIFINNIAEATIVSNFPNPDLSLTKPGGGGAIFSIGKLEITGSHFEDNRAPKSGQFGTNEQHGFGGAVWVENSLTDGEESNSAKIKSSFFFANRSNGTGGALYIYTRDNKLTVSVENSVFYKNNAYGNNMWGGGGGGISVDGIDVDSPFSEIRPIYITNSTFSGNTQQQYGAGNGGDNLFTDVNIGVANTIFSYAAGLNSPPTNYQNCAGRQITDSSGNIQYPGNSCRTTTPLSIRIGEPNLAIPNIDNVTLRSTVQLKPGSAAINNGITSKCTSVDYTGSGRNGICDSGAYEYQGTLPHIKVNSVADSDDGKCDSTSVGGCTLREAIFNAASGETVLFDFATATTITVATPVVVTRSMIIGGKEHNSRYITISGNNQTRIFEVDQGVKGVQFHWTTLREGKMEDNSRRGGAVRVKDDAAADFYSVVFEDNDAGSGSSNGGAVAVLQRATVTVRNSTFLRNKAQTGGAISITDNASLMIYSSHFEDNGRPTSITTHPNGVYSYGGAIATEGYANSIGIYETTFTRNHAVFGGAISLYPDDPTRTVATIEKSTFLENYSNGWGGAILASQGLQIKGTDFLTNKAFIGGAIRLRAGTVITDTTFEANSAYLPPNRIESMWGWGGSIAFCGASNYNLNLSKSTFAYNNARYRGGAIANEAGCAGDTYIRNSTFSTNTAVLEGGGVISVENNSSFDAQFSTFFSNYSGQPTAQTFYMAPNSGSSKLRSNIIYSSNPNQHSFCSQTNLINNDYNLFFPASTKCTGWIAITGDPQLGTLSENGVKTKTHALGAGSLATGKVPVGECLQTDQRGRLRYTPSDSTPCDIGAYEDSNLIAPEVSGDRPGVVDKDVSAWYLHNSFSNASIGFGGGSGGSVSPSGFTAASVLYPPVDVAFIYGGAPNAAIIPLKGDWNGDGYDTPGTYDRRTGVFRLTDRNGEPNGATVYSFIYGDPNNSLTPLVGDWNADGKDTIGLYNPANGAWLLRNTLSNGLPDIVFPYGEGGQGYKPVVGDWNGDGYDTQGLFNPANGAWILANVFNAGPFTTPFPYGDSTMNPVIGDWDGNGTDTPGMYYPPTGAWLLINQHASIAPQISFTIKAPANSVQFAGRWLPVSTTSGGGAAAPIRETIVTATPTEPQIAPTFAP